jgi:hypothetical protein
LSVSTARLCLLKSHRERTAWIHFIISCLALVGFSCLPPLPASPRMCYNFYVSSGLSGRSLSSSDPVACFTTSPLNPTSFPRFLYQLYQLLFELSCAFEYNFSRLLISRRIFFVIRKVHCSGAPIVPFGWTNGRHTL